MKIPRYISEVVPSVPDVSAQAAAMPYEARAELGAAVRDIGSKLLDTNLKLAEEKRRITRELLSGQSIEDYYANMEKMKLEEVKRPNKAGHYERMMARSLEVQAELLERFKHDKDQLERMKVTFSSLHNRTMAEARRQDNLYFIEGTRATTIDYLFKLKDRIDREEDEREREIMLSEGQARLESLYSVDPDWMATKKAELLDFARKVNADKNFANALLEVNATKGDPERLNEIYKKYDIPIERQPVIASHARVLQNEERARKDREVSLELVADVNRMFWDIRGTEAYNTAREKQLRDPAYLKAMGATLEQGKRAIEFIHNEELWEEKRRIKAYEPIQSALLGKLIKGELTIEEVRNSGLPATGLAQGDQIWFIEKLEQIKTKRDSFLTSDRDTLTRVYVGVLTEPEKWNKSKIFALIGKTKPDGSPGGLSIVDAEKLYEKWDNLTGASKPEMENKNPLFKIALERMNDFRKAFMFVPGEEKDRYTEKDVIINDANYMMAVDRFWKETEGGNKNVIEVWQKIMLETSMKKVTTEKKGWFRGLFDFFKGEGTEMGFSSLFQPPPEGKPIAPTFQELLDARKFLEDNKVEVTPENLKKTVDYLRKKNVGKGTGK